MTTITINRTLAQRMLEMLLKVEAEFKTYSACTTETEEERVLYAAITALRAALAQQAESHRDLRAALQAPGCERLREWVEIGPVQRAAMETFAAELRLVACGVVALADTPDSAKHARQMHPDCESAACQDVARRVDECISLRTQRDALLEALKEVVAFTGAHGGPYAKARAAIKAVEENT